MSKVLSVSNNDYILQKGDLVKIVKQVNYVGGPIIEINKLYLIKETWNTTSGDIVLQKNTEEYDFAMHPCNVNKVLNFDSIDKENEKAYYGVSI